MRSTFAIVLNTVAALALAACALRYVATLWPLLVVNSLQTHIALAAAGATAFAFLLSRNAASALLFAAAMALAGHSVVMKREFAIAPTEAERAAAPQLRVLSFNMLQNNMTNASRVADMVMASGADVAVMLEGGPLLVQLTRLAGVYPYRVGCGERTPTCDLMIFSRHPLADIDVGSLSELRQDRFMSASVTVPAGTVRIAAAHLTKPFFDTYHIKELLRLRAMIHNAPLPLVLAGDFNSATIAPDMQRLVRDLNLRTAPFEPATWPVALAPIGLGIAIDHIYARPPLIPLSVRRLDSDYGSNHYGLIADFAFRKP